MKLLITSVLALCIALLQGSAMVKGQAPSRPTRELDLATITSGKAICLGTAAQFLDEDTLVALVGSSSACYRDLSGVELISFSTAGQLISRRHWSSTFPFVTIEGRVIVSTSDELMVLDKTLQVVQSVSLSSWPHMAVSLHVANPPTVSLFPGQAQPARVFQLSGDPLVLKQISPDSTEVATLGNGDVVTWNGKELLRTRNGHTVSTYEIAWLQNCSSLCQAWTGVQVTVVSSLPSARAVLLAKGSKVPLTDSGGLFPFTRVLVLDLNSGQSVFQQQYFTDQSERAAALDETGSMLVITDKRHLSLYSLTSPSNH